MPILKLGTLAMVIITLAGNLTAQEWEPLIKNDSLENFVQRGGDATYEVQDGVLIGRTAPMQRENAFLCTKDTWRDFELELEFKVDPALNSGIQIRSESLPHYKGGRVHGYQVEIDPSDRSWSGGIYDESRRGWLADLSENEEARKAFKPGEWNKFYIACRGDSIRTKINDVDAVSINDNMTTRGFIAFQVHSVKTSQPLEIRWRNIRIRDWDKVAISHWESDSPFGDYAGKDANDKPVFAQIIDLGDGRYHAKFLPDANGEGDALAESTAVTDNNVITFASGGVNAIIADGTFEGTLNDVKFSMNPAPRVSPTMGQEPPDDAVVLFDGKDASEWQTADGKPAPWKVTADGALEIVPGSGNIETKKTFGDMDLHLEFRTSLMPYARGQQRSNSGVYVQGTYEIQILDSYGLSGEDNECGGIYKVGAPRVNMAYPPLQWQTYDISFRAARWEGDKKTENARITVKHNGEIIHDDLELPDATGGAKFKGEPNHPAPLLLQEHRDKVQFRNIWVRPHNP